MYKDSISQVMGKISINTGWMKTFSISTSILFTILSAGNRNKKQQFNINYFLRSFREKSEYKNFPTFMPRRNENICNQNLSF